MERNGQAWFMAFCGGHDAIGGNAARHGGQLIFFAAWLLDAKGAYSSLLSVVLSDGGESH